MLVLLFDNSPIMYSNVSMTILPNFLVKFFDDIFGCLQFLSYKQKLPVCWGV